ncbi:MAG: phage holin family protein [Clostridia bacterium]|nr:phage holin family protein [Clostridia bacterium]
MNEQALVWFKTVFAVLGTAISTALGGWDLALKVLVVFVILDYATGVTAAWFERKLNSDIGLKGIAKKILLFVPVALGYYLDQVLGQQVFRNLAIFFYLANEGLSIIENLSRCGIPVPDALKNALGQLSQEKQEQ